MDELIVDVADCAYNAAFDSMGLKDGSTRACMEAALVAVASLIKAQAYRELTTLRPFRNVQVELQLLASDLEEDRR